METVAAPRQRQYPRVTPIIERMTFDTIAPTDDTLLRLILAYQRQYGLGENLDLHEHLAIRWKAMRYEGRVVAVFGERDYDANTVEVTDAYAEPSRLGRIAMYAGCLRYLASVDEGEKRRLLFTVLFDNRAMWTAVIRETRRMPYALKFSYEGR